jgi:hypothetical protein
VLEVEVFVGGMTGRSEIAVRDVELGNYAVKGVLAVVTGILDCMEVWMGN